MRKVFLLLAIAVPMVLLGPRTAAAQSCTGSSAPLGVRSEGTIEFLGETNWVCDSGVTEIPVTLTVKISPVTAKIAPASASPDHISTFPFPTITSTVSFAAAPTVSISTSGSDNTVSFSFTPGAGAQTFTVSGIRANIAASGISGGVSVTSLLTVSPTGPGQLTFTNPSQTVAFARFGLTSVSGFVSPPNISSCAPAIPTPAGSPATVAGNPDASLIAANSLRVNLVENFPTAWHDAASEDGASGPDGISGTGDDGTGGAPLYGTRFLVTLTNIPSGFTPYAPQEFNATGLLDPSTGLFAPSTSILALTRVTGAAADGSGGAPLGTTVANSFDRITVTGGTATIVYEVTATDSPAKFNNISFFIALTGAATTGTGTISGSAGFGAVGPPANPHRPQFIAAAAKTAAEVTACADIAITKTDSSDPVESGGALTYTLTVENLTSLALGFATDDVTVTDPLPAGVSFVSCTASTGSCSEAAGIVTALLGTLAAQASEVVTIEVTAPAVAASTLLTNTATVTTSTEEGPADNNQASQTTTVNPVGGPPGGGITALAIDPVNPAILYAGTAGGGFFKSTNGGVSWFAADIGLPTVGVFSLAIDPANTATLYAGLNGNVDSVFTSTDGGMSWSAASSGLTDTIVLSLAIDPASPSTLYAGTATGAFIPGDGVFLSTDGGATWAIANSGLPSAFVFSLAIDPASAGTVYAGTSSGVFVTTDGGAGWTGINTGLTDTMVRSVVVDPANPGTLYAGTDGGGVFQSVDGGANWIAVNTGLTNTQVVSLAIGTLYAGTDGGGVFKSEDGGASWTELNSTLAATLAEIAHMPLAVDPVNLGTLYAGTADGVFKSTDGGASWQPTGTSEGGGAPPATTIAMVSGDNQSGAVGEVLAHPFVVVVTNADGVPVAGVTVTFAVTEGGGTLSLTQADTDDQGVVSSILTLGPSAGANTVTATSGTLAGSPVTFNATGVAEPGGTGVVIDVKPSVNPRSRGVIPVAILTTDDFDASTVAPGTERFGPDEAVIAHRSGHFEDVDLDGDTDLMLHFRTQETGIQCGDTEATLTGETFDGQSFQASDSIVTVGCHGSGHGPDGDGEQGLHADDDDEDDDDGNDGGRGRGKKPKKEK